jgi:predicted ATP-dependent endonuclease of OLD family
LFLASFYRLIVFLCIERLKSIFCNFEEIFLNPFDYNMYIQKVTIKNIRAIRNLEITFPKPAGWHVLIGDNGSGKSSIIRSIAAALIGPDEIMATLPNWNEWLSKGAEKGTIRLELQPDWEYDKNGNGPIPKDKNIINEFTLEENKKGRVGLKTNINQKILPPSNYNWSDNDGWFSVGYGPFRRFTGGDERRSDVFNAAPKAGAHLSVFGEDVALTEALEWLKELNEKSKKSINSLANSGEKIKNELKKITEEILLIQKEFNRNKYDDELNIRIENITKRHIVLEEKITPETYLLVYIRKFLNKSKLLLHNTHFHDINDDGDLIFKDGYGNLIPITEMSDGFRSILSFILELLRQLVNTYGEEKVFINSEKESFTIDVPGVVIIDEIDAHLHPTWQTEIGKWFTTYFPNIQFIVTTHSPLVCRAANRGSIWQLAKPGSEAPFREIVGLEKERLVHGNILEAYGTEAFGQTAVRSVESDGKKKLLGELNIKFALGNITEEEEKERQELQKILSTDAPITF